MLLSLPIACLYIPLRLPPKCRGSCSSIAFSFPTGYCAMHNDRISPAQANVYCLQTVANTIRNTEGQYEGHNTPLGCPTDQGPYRAMVSMMAKGCIVAFILPLRCFLFLLPNYCIVIQWFSYLDKRQALQQEYSQPPILPSPHFRWGSK